MAAVTSCFRGSLGTSWCATLASRPLVVVAVALGVSIVSAVALVIFFRSRGSDVNTSGDAEPSTSTSEVGPSSSGDLSVDEVKFEEASVGPHQMRIRNFLKDASPKDHVLILSELWHEIYDETDFPELNDDWKAIEVAYMYEKTYLSFGTDQNIFDEIASFRGAIRNKLANSKSGRFDIDRLEKDWPIRLTSRRYRNSLDVQLHLRALGESSSDATIAILFKTLRELPTADHTFFGIGAGGVSDQMWPRPLIEARRIGQSVVNVQFDPIPLTKQEAGEAANQGNQHLYQTEDQQSPAIFYNFACGWGSLRFATRASRRDLPGRIGPAIRWKDGQQVRDFQELWSKKVKNLLLSGKKVYMGCFMDSNVVPGMADLYNELKEEYPDQIYLLIGHEGWGCVVKGQYGEEERQAVRGAVSAHHTYPPGGRECEGVIDSQYDERLQQGVNFWDIPLPESGI